MGENILVQLLGGVGAAAVVGATSYVTRKVLRSRRKQRELRDAAGRLRPDLERDRATLAEARRAERWWGSTTRAKRTPTDEDHKRVAEALEDTDRDALDRAVESLDEVMDRRSNLPIDAPIEDDDRALVDEAVRRIEEANDVLARRFG
jgi:hypothetical protein